MYASVASSTVIEARQRTDASAPDHASLPAEDCGRRRRSLSGRSTSSSRAAADEEAQQFIKDWGITFSEEDKCLQEFAHELNSLGVLKPWHDMYLLRRFLRARQHNIPKAKTMFLAFLNWRNENHIDTILRDFQFTERTAFLQQYPQGYHKTDKLGRPVYIQYVGMIDMTELKKISSEERMINFHIQEMERAVKYILPGCSRVAGRHIDQTFNIVDLKGLGMKHMTAEVTRLLSKVFWIDQNMYPEMLGHTCVINAPSIFKYAWAMVKPMLDVRTQNKVEFCGEDHTAALLEWIAPENLLVELGGQSQGTLLEDVGPWNDASVTAEIDAEWSLDHAGQA